MSSQTLIFIILAGITALLLALFQYIYKSNKRKLNIVLACFRFITLFAVLLLLINPKFEQTTIYNEKPKLVVAIDNSESIKHLSQEQNVDDLVSSIKNDQALNDFFDVNYYSFGGNLNTNDSLSFAESQTNISKVFSDLNQIYKDQKTPIVLISDGNQTYGNDYQYNTKITKQPVFSVILGDTITYSDLKIQQLNVNKYAYLKNKFPVEVIVVYNGNNAVTSQLVISSGNSVVFRETLNFSNTTKAHTVNITLPASRVGVTAYNARILPLDNEKNIINNAKPFAVEVIDQKTSVAIVSDMVHPDLGAIKKSIESNEQRSVEIVSPNEYLTQYEDFQLAILYQPSPNFRSVFETLTLSGINALIITGTETHWPFLNGIQNDFEIDYTQQNEYYLPELNTNYSTFIVDDLNFGSFSPLQGDFGSLSFNQPVASLLYKRINNTILDEPLLVTFEDNNRRTAALFGEGIWKWRAQSYLNEQSFQQFDNFIGKLVQYLASNKKRNRLNVNYESFYSGNGDVKIDAQFFNKNYEFDDQARLSMTLKDVESLEETILPFVLKQFNYELDLSGFKAGTYDFTVSANGGEVVRFGQLKILDYNIEQQFLNADVDKLQFVGAQSNGSSYFINYTDALIPDLLSDSRFVIVQKSSKNVVPLIDIKFLLALIALSLALEWFVRKYNGLI
ncbi:MAG: VWA domain-containing protein [Flavobacteriaceae bacterium]|nr:VWA domain-containing protein [Flavobacteriaceae bacterium]